jgi:hypothetical protein
MENTSIQPMEVDFFVSKVDPPESLLAVLANLVEYHQAISTDK